MADRGMRAAGLWLAPAIASSAAALRLIDAPPAVAYQHYRPAWADTGDRLAIIVLVASAFLLLVAGRSHVAAALRWVRNETSLPARVLLIGAVVATAAAPSREPGFYAGEILLATLVQVLVGLLLVAAARSLPDDPPAALGTLLGRMLGRPGDPGPARLDRWAVTVAGLVVLCTASIAVFAYERHPHVPDEVVYLLHARYFAEGMLTLPAPPVPPAFNIDLMYYEASRWFSPVNPGWPLVLASGTWLGVPWLVNPVLGGLSILLAYRLLGGMYDQRTTRLAVLLLGTSPWFLFMSMNFMTHTLTLVCALAAALGVARARRDGSGAASFLAGLGIGALALIRPLEGLAVAMLLGLWSLGARGRRFRFAPSALLVSGAVAVGLSVLPYNDMLSGDPLRFPIMAYVDKYYAPGSNAMGFGPDRGMGWGGLDPFPGHGVRDVLVNALLNLSQVNVELLGWATGSIVVVAAVVALGVRGLSRHDWWQVAVILVIIAVHAFYWFSGGPDFGARYWYLIIVPCVALAARAITRVDRAPAPAPRSVPRATALALVLMAVTLALYVPWRSSGKYRHYRGMRPDVRELARRHDFGESLVLVRGRRHPDYASAAVYNPIDLRAAAPVYAWDAAPDLRRRVLEAYRGRTVWILDGPSITGDGYRIAAGPLTWDEARASPIPPSTAGGERHIYDPVNPRDPYASSLRQERDSR